ncbi:MAG: O-antigen ligase domain-containing protein [Microcoleaceae cyanobacterium]
MTPQAQLILLAWLPILLYFFRYFSARRAIVIGFIAAWLFLPQQTKYILLGFPDYDRTSATCYSIVLSAILFDFRQLKSFKFGWIDVFMLMWCFAPAASSLTNGLGLYDGLSSALAHIIQYGCPYFIGRIYLGDLTGLRQLAVSIFISGVIYAPLCWFESIMSPQLHRLVYGYHGIRQFGQSYRLGGYRPNVFMIHGLSVGMWMMAAALIGVWLWQARVLKHFLNIPMGVWVAGLIFTHIIVRSTGAYLYMLFGLLILLSAKWLRTALPLLILICSLAFYLSLGVTGNFTGEQADQIISVASDIAGSERAQSLQFRFDNEELLVEKAQERMIFGWGGWGRNRVYDYNHSGELVDITVTDSLWVIAYGSNGIVGLVGVFGSLLVPAVGLIILRYPGRTWFHPKVAPAAVLAVILTLYALDNCLNDQYNPVFTVVSGAMAGLVLKQPESRQLKRPHQSPLLVRTQPPQVIEVKKQS